MHYLIVSWAIGKRLTDRLSPTQTKPYNKLDGTILENLKGSWYPLRAPGKYSPFRLQQTAGEAAQSQVSLPWYLSDLAAEACSNPCRLSAACCVPVDILAGSRLYFRTIVAHMSWFLLYLV